MKESVSIDGIEYIPKSRQEIVSMRENETVASRMIGKNVITRSHNEGINVGTVVVADETGVELSNCRRIWEHKPKDKGLSWYEGVAISGCSDDTIVSGTVETKTIIEKYSMTLCSDEAYKTLMGITPNAQR